MKILTGWLIAQDGVVYRCTRSTGIPVYNPLAQLSLRELPKQLRRIAGRLS